MRKTRKFLNILTIIFLVVLILLKMQNPTIKSIRNYIFNGFKNLISNIEEIFSSENKSSDQNIRNITFKTEDDEYFAIIEFNSIYANDIEELIINNKSFTTFIIDENNNRLITINITSLISTSDQTEIKITAINTTKENFENTFETVFYKSVNYEIIELKKKSIVGISASKNNFFTETNHIWGSGVIFNKKEIITNDFWGREKKAYEYLILTNFHVVDGSNSFKIHYEKLGNNYPKNKDDKIVLIGTYTYHTDLAVLKLTTTDSSLISLDDDCFTTKEVITVKKNQLVFAVGSPSDGENINFNSYKIGHVVNANESISKLKDSDLCAEGCHCIQTTAYQGEGSSGGGVFDLDGNFIGLHFAGNSQLHYSYEIPLETILEALEHILIDYNLAFLQNNKTEAFNLVFN